MFLKSSFILGESALTDLNKAFKVSETFFFILCYLLTQSVRQCK